MINEITENQGDAAILAQSKAQKLTPSATAVQDAPNFKVVNGISSNTVMKQGGLSENLPEREGLTGWEANYWELFDNSINLIHIYNAEGRFTAINKRWIEVLGYSREEALQMTLPDMVHSDLLAACLNIFLNFDRGIQYTDFETILVAKNGSAVYAKGRMVPYVENGTLVSVRQEFHDVSFEKKAEAVLKGLAEGLIVTDKQRNITLSNKAAEKMLGKNKTELLGQKWPNVLGTKGVTNQEGKEVIFYNLPFYTALTQNKRSFSRHYSYMGKDNQPFPVATSAAPVILEGETTGVVEVFRDITEEKAAEKLKNDFLNNTTHELKTPLIPIKSQAQLLLTDSYGELNEKQKESIEMILRNEAHLESLVTDVMNISKLHSNKITFSFEEVNLKELIEQAILDMQASAKERGLNLILEPFPETPNLHLDKKRITQVVGNLLNNALKFTPAGGTITVEVRKNENEVITTITDTGIGLSADSIKKLFTPFFQVDSDLARKYSGTGLGLSICKGFIEAHGGTIHAESEGEGKGSEFIFTLPISKGPIAERIIPNAEITTNQPSTAAEQSNATIRKMASTIPMQPSEKTLQKKFDETKGSDVI